MPGRDEDKLYSVEDLADGLLDWLDSDDLTRLGDDEDTYWERQGAAVSPVNRPIWILDELGEIPGLDGALLEALRAYFTTYPVLPELAQSGVNPNTAPPHVLKLIYQGTAGDMRLVNDSDVFAILRVRDEGRIFCPDTGQEQQCASFESEVGQAGATVFPPLSYRSNVFTIRSEARYGESRACLTTVIDRTQVQDLATLSFRLDCG